MRLVTYSYKDKTGLGIVFGERIMALPKRFGTMLDLLEAGVSQAAAYAPARRTLIPLQSARLHAPIPNPRKVFCLAGNYAEHIREGKRTVGEKDMVTPRVFMKPVSNTVIGPYDPIRIPRTQQFVDWEGELAVVIGKKCKYVPEAKAMSVVAGYTILHDVSERRLKIRQRPESAEWDRFFDWLNGKWCDTFAPTGPWLVTKDEIKDPHNLKLETRVNGVVKQSGNTGQMIFTVPNIIEYLSHFLTLEPGDLIATGTPSGVGHARGENLKPGDVVEVEIEKIGCLRNKVVAEK